MDSWKQLTIYTSESARWQHKPLHLAILELAKKEGLSGAMVTRGMEGFGLHHTLQTTDVLALASDLPIEIRIIDMCFALLGKGQSLLGCSQQSAESYSSAVALYTRKGFKPTEQTVSTGPFLGFVGILHRDKLQHDIGKVKPLIGSDLTWMSVAWTFSKAMFKQPIGYLSTRLNQYKNVI